MYVHTHTQTRWIIFKSDKPLQIFSTKLRSFEISKFFIHCQMKGIGEPLTFMALWVGYIFSFVFLISTVPKVVAISKQIEDFSQYKITHFAATLPCSPDRYLHQLKLPSNIVTLELSSEIKYFRIDFSIFTLNANKVTILFRSAAKPILSYFQQVKYLSPTGTWISETKERKVTAIVYRPKIWFYFIGLL